MEPLVKESNQPEIIELNLEKINSEAENSYRYLLKKQPHRFPSSAFAVDLGKTSPKYEHLTQQLIENAPKLVDLSEIDPFINPTKLQSFEVEDVEKVQNGLLKFGINIDKSDLLRPFSENEDLGELTQKYTLRPQIGLINIIAGIQEEYVKTLSAARKIEIVQKILKNHAPLVPVPSHNSYYFLTRTNSDRDNHGTASTNKLGDHLIEIKTRFGSQDYEMSASQTNLATVEEYYSDSITTAAHELSHTTFDEIFDLESLNRADEIRDNHDINLFRVLTEGYAIINERVMAEVLKKIVPELPENFNFGPQIISDRNYYLYDNKDDPKGRLYLDGFKLMRRLIWGLGVYNAPKQQQVRVISEFLKKVDIVKVASIKPDNEEYKDIIEDPFHKLPTTKN